MIRSGTLVKIKRKPPKSPRAARPLYLVGYSTSPPQLIELQVWFDLEYGGPLKLGAAAQKQAGRGASTVTTHGPWSATLRTELAEPDAEAWKVGLSWRHESAAAVIPSSVTPANAYDTVLHAARLARGLTLMTDGTAYDMATGSYLNPSDWSDRRLTVFQLDEHIVVQQAESDRAGYDWFHTLGLAKFGRDELETYRPAGLPDRPVHDRLIEIAGDLQRQGLQPRVGETVVCQSSGLRVSILRHRTIPVSGTAVGVREIAWESTA